MRFAQTTRTPAAMNRSPQRTLANNLVVTGTQAAAQLVGPFPVANHPQVYVQVQNVVGAAFVSYDVFFYDDPPAPTDLTGAASILSVQMATHGTQTGIVVPVVGAYMAVRINGGAMAPTDTVAFRILGVAQGVIATQLTTLILSGTTPSIAAGGAFIDPVLRSTVAGRWQFYYSNAGTANGARGIVRQEITSGNLTPLAADTRADTFDHSIEVALGPWPSQIVITNPSSAAQVFAWALAPCRY